MKKERICAWCYYARMRTDICGIYCTGGFENQNGTCAHYKSWQEYKNERNKMRAAKKEAT